VVCLSSRDRRGLDQGLCRGSRRPGPRASDCCIPQYLQQAAPAKACRKRLRRRLAWRLSNTNGDIERKPKDIDPPGSLEGCYPKWAKLAKATREDYLKAYCWLADVFDEKLADITTPELYELRDTCAAKKKTRFADKMIRALSSMFKQGVKRGKMERNPCFGIDRAHEADPNANRE
jgi:hypothetical protein